MNYNGENEEDAIYLQETNAVDKNILTKADILGHWEVQRATYKSTGEELPLQHLYGTGIAYGGGVDFFEDGTAKEEIGITSGEELDSKITYTIKDNIIKILDNDNVVFEYEYIKDSNKTYLKSLRNNFSEEYYLYFTK